MALVLAWTSPVVEGGERLWHCAWDGDGKRIATCGADRAVRVWRVDVATGDVGGGDVGGGDVRAAGPRHVSATCIAVLDDVAARTVRCVEWAPSGRSLAAACFDGKTRVWEARSGAIAAGAHFDLVATLEGHENEVKGVSWCPVECNLATCGRDKSVWVWEAEGGGEGGEFECAAVLNDHRGDVKSVRWHPTLPHLFSASYDDTVKVWAEVGRDWRCVETLAGHTSTVWQLAFDATGTRMVSCSDDRSLIVWSHDGERWRLSYTLAAAHERTIFSVDWCRGAHGVIASGGEDDAIVLHAEDAEAARAAADGEPMYTRVARVAGAHSSDVNCVRWSPDGALLASVGDDGCLRLWAFDEGKLWDV